MEDQRSCFTCKLFSMCITRIKIEEALRYTRTNIDGDSAPGKYIQVFDATGNCCVNHQEEKL